MLCFISNSVWQLPFLQNEGYLGILKFLFVLAAADFYLGCRELQGHANAVQEAEAALAAARERHNKTHSHLGNLRYCSIDTRCARHGLCAGVTPSQLISAEK